MSDCILHTGAVTSNGYGRVKRGGVNYLRHRLALAEASGRPYNNSDDACHTCDNPACYNTDHLYWGTRSQNLIDKSLRARRGATLKLTPEQVRRIKFGGGTAVSLAAEFNVTKECIYHIRHGVTWRHIKE